MSVANRIIRHFSFESPYQTKYLAKTVKHPQYWMIWGCFKSNNIGPLIFIDGHVNAKKYIEILDQSIKDFCKEDEIFQDDSAPAHRAKIVKEFLMKKI